MGRRGIRRVSAAMLLLSLASAPAALAQDPPAAPAEAVTLLLDVTVNGWPLGLVGRFESADGRLSLSAEQFEGLGFIPNPEYVTVVDGRRRVDLARVPGLTWRIEPSLQRLYIVAPYALLTPQRMSINPGPARVEARSDWGAAFSYDLFGEWAGEGDDPVFRRSISGDLSLRLFGPRFTAETTGYFIPGADPRASSGWRAGSTSRSPTGPGRCGSATPSAAAWAGAGRSGSAASSGAATSRSDPTSSPSRCR